LERGVGVAKPVGIGFCTCWNSVSCWEGWCIGAPICWSAGDTSLGIRNGLALAGSGVEVEAGSSSCCCVEGKDRGTAGMGCCCRWFGWAKRLKSIMMLEGCGASGEWSFEAVEFAAAMVFRNGLCRLGWGVVAGDRVWSLSRFEKKSSSSFGCSDATGWGGVMAFEGAEDLDRQRETG
jgi:hypothetical protein